MAIQYCKHSVASVFFNELVKGKWMKQFTDLNKFINSISRIDSIEFGFVFFGRSLS